MEYKIKDERSETPHLSGHSSFGHSRAKSIATAAIDSNLQSVKLMDYTIKGRDSSTDLSLRTIDIC